MVFARGQLKGAGSMNMGRDYEELDNTHIAFYMRFKAGDILEYLYLEDVAPQQ